MSVRPPKSLMRASEAGSPGGPMMAALEHELLVERGETLVRVAKRFEARLAGLRQMSADDPARPKQVAETARARWMLAVQREVIGLPGGESLLRAYDVPDEVRRASGIVTRKVMRGRRRRPAG